MRANILKDNYEKFIDELSKVCNTTGKNLNDINIVAVSKTFTSEDIITVNGFGQKAFGENKVQELIEKENQISIPDIRWHLIGHLQTNKVKYVLRFVYLIHSVDSLKLAAEINKRAESAESIENKVNILVQVNTSGEDSKSGVEPDETEDLCDAIAGFDKINLCGLMTISKLDGTEDEIRKNFSTLKRLYDKLSSTHKNFKYLSMGMTSDYKIAIEEGSNMIRVGSAIFGNRNYN